METETIILIITNVVVPIVVPFNIIVIKGMCSPVLLSFTSPTMFVSVFCFTSRVFAYIPNPKTRASIKKIIFLCISLNFVCNKYWYSYSFPIYRSTRKGLMKSYINYQTGGGLEKRKEFLKDKGIILSTLSKRLHNGVNNRTKEITKRMEPTI